MNHRFFIVAVRGVVSVDLMLTAQIKTCQIEAIISGIVLNLWNNLTSPLKYSVWFVG